MMGKEKGEFGVPFIGMIVPLTASERQCQTSRGQAVMKENSHS